MAVRTQIENCYVYNDPRISYNEPLVAYNGGDCISIERKVRGGSRRKTSKQSRELLDILFRTLTYVSSSSEEFDKTIRKFSVEKTPGFTVKVTESERTTKTRSKNSISIKTEKTKLTKSSQPYVSSSFEKKKKTEE